MSLAHGRVDAVLIDVVMPEVSGVDLARMLQESTPGIGIVFMSAYPAEVLVREGLHDLRVEFLAKPFTREDLLRAVATAAKATARGESPASTGKPTGAATSPKLTRSPAIPSRAPARPPPDQLPPHNEPSPRRYAFVRTQLPPVGRRAPHRSQELVQHFRLDRLSQTAARMGRHPPTAHAEHGKIGTKDPQCLDHYRSRKPSQVQLHQDHAEARGQSLDELQPCQSIRCVDDVVSPRLKQLADRTSRSHIVVYHEREAAARRLILGHQFAPNRVHPARSECRPSSLPRTAAFVTRLLCLRSKEGRIG